MARPVSRSRPSSCACLTSAPDWKLLLAAGFAFAGDLGFWHWSIRFTSVANSIMAVTTSLTALFLLPAAPHCAGQGLIAYSLAHLPAAFSSVSLLFQPVMAAVFAWILLSEPLVPLQIVGGVVVLAGIYLARRGSS